METHGPLNIAVFVEDMFQENGLLLWPTGSTDCWVVDPGFPPQPDHILAAVAERGLSPQAILLTHCHPDHLAGVNTFRRRLPTMPLWVPRDEAHMLADPRANLSEPMGFPVNAPPADRLLAPGERLGLGPLAWAVLDVAGHSPGGLAYYCAAAGVVLTGDALFSGSIGRCDFPGSSGQRLLRNIRANLLTLPPQTVVYSGHGPATTIGRERTDNPFLAGGQEP
jgi:glyoxylase-like metal-dependent hydrolase (beta-lactamase superfamily II)